MRNVESLETRRLFASFAASSVAELISDMNAANAAGGSNTITLAAGATFNLSAVDNSTDGPTGLPVIAAGDDLTLVGNGATLQRSTARGIPAFRLLDVAAGASLAVSDLTLSYGLSVDGSVFPYASPQGGAIRSLGTLTLARVTVENCVAQAGGINGPAFGGGIFSGGASAVLTIADSTIRNNRALGANGVQITANFQATGGGPAYGGGVYAYGSSASLTNVTIDSNVAAGGNGAAGYSMKIFKSPTAVAGGPGGNAYGGGIYAAATTGVELRGTTVTRNAATGGAGGNSPKGLAKGANGLGQGGGIYVYPGASASLDSFTQGHTTGNTASTSDNDIFGSFTIL